MRIAHRSIQTAGVLLAAGLALVPASSSDAVVRESTPAAASTGEVVAPPRSNGLVGSRWNPCEPITYRINPRGGYPGSVRHLRQAFGQVSEATGVGFVYLGSTDRVALRDDPDPRADITVSWATAAQVPQLRGSVAGLASTTIVTRRDGVFENIKGQIALDRAATLRRGFAATGPTTWGQVYLHEISHVMGLDHVNQRRQLMYPVVNGDNHTFGAGDRARLRQVGRAAGCVQASSR